MVSLFLYTGFQTIPVSSPLPYFGFLQSLVSPISESFLSFLYPIGFLLVDTVYKYWSLTFLLLARSHAILPSALFLIVLQRLRCLPPLLKIELCVSFFLPFIR